MFSLIRRRPGILIFIGATGAIAVFAGCESEPRSAHRGPAGTPPAATSAPIPEMEAQGAFFNGQIETDVLLNKVGFAARDAAASGQPGSRGGGSGFHGGFGG